jgi:hypothetical protein
MRLYAIQQTIAGVTMLTGQAIISHVYTSRLEAVTRLDQLQYEFNKRTDINGNPYEVVRVFTDVVTAHRIADKSTCRFEIIELDANRI